MDDVRRRDILRSVTFGARVAEDETELLAAYFVETDLWHQLYGGSVDIIYGAKGSGKSALYSLLLTRAEELNKKGIVLIAGENLRGAPVFRDLTIDPPASERECVGLWKLYMVCLLQHALAEHDVRNDAAKEIAGILEREGLLQGKRSLSGLLRSVISYARRALRPGALEGQLEIDPLTQLPKGLSGKITFSDAEKVDRNSGMQSVDELLALAGRALSDAGLIVWLAFDRLDVAFADTPDVEANVLRALFRVYLDMLAITAVRLKIFLRSDIWDRITSKGFREGSHITRYLRITWTRDSLLNLIVRRLLHNPAICAEYKVDESLAGRSLSEQERFLYSVCPDRIVEGLREETTFEWVLMRTRDGSKATMPRELIHFFACLREVQVRKIEVGARDGDGPHLFSEAAFSDSLFDVSRSRLEQTLLAEHPDQKEWLEKLRGANALQTPQSLASLWSVSDADAALRCTKLVEIGFFERRGTRQAPEYWVPFLYSEAMDMPQAPARRDLGHRLKAYLTPLTPLGPNDAARVGDLEVAAKIFDSHNRAFETLLRRDLAVLIGRRGSGKTALLNSYKYRPFLESIAVTDGVNPRSDFYAYGLVMDILSYRQFDEMQRIAARDASVFRPIETIVDDWETLITDYFLARLVAEEVDSGRDSARLALIRRYLLQDTSSYQSEVRRLVWGQSLWERLKNAFRPASAGRSVSREDAMQAAEEHLIRRGIRAVLLIDSMDEYALLDRDFTRVLAALIRFVSYFNESHDAVKAKLALPVEIFPEVQRSSANPLKDLVNVDHIVWSASELAQLAAHRYRLFLEIYDPVCAAQLQRLDLNKHRDVREFWSFFFGEQLVSESGDAESPLTYIMRNTQLLPRQVLMLFQTIIVRSAQRNSSYRRFASEIVKDAVETVQPLFAAEIFGAYDQVYPFAEAICRAVLAGAPMTFSYDELEDRWRKKGRPVVRDRGVEMEMPEFGEMLARMGIIGSLTDETARYFEASFAYDSLAPSYVAGGQRLCLHPIFARHFNATTLPSWKAILPVGSHDW